MPYRRVIHWHTASRSKPWVLSLGATALIGWSLLCFWFAVGACAP